MIVTCDFASAFSINSAFCKLVEKHANGDSVTAGHYTALKCQDWSQSWVFVLHHYKFIQSLSEAIGKQGLLVTSKK